MGCPCHHGDCNDVLQFLVATGFCIIHAYSQATKLLDSSFSEQGFCWTHHLDFISFSLCPPTMISTNLNARHLQGQRQIHSFACLTRKLLWYSVESCVLSIHSFPLMDACKPIFNSYTFWHNSLVDKPSEFSKIHCLLMIFITE